MRIEFLENTNDPFSNTKLAQSFESVDKKLWLDITEMLFLGNFNIEELQYLEILAAIIKVPFLIIYYSRKICSNI